MTELLTAAQMRTIEQAAIASGEVTGLELMERAGRGVVEAIFDEWPEMKATSHRAVVLCGPGNNGGDGFVVARLLHDWGWAVEVFLYGDSARMPPEARANYQRWLGLGAVKLWTEIDETTTADADLFVDALFGTGLTRPLDHKQRGVLALLTMGRGRISEKPEKRAVCVAVDVRSGFDADSGLLLDEEPQEWFEGYFADLTVTFQRPRVGHLLSPVRPRLLLGAWGNGKLVVRSIGLERWVEQLNQQMTVDQDDTLLWTYRSHLKKLDDNHKYTHGHALILSGPPGHTGAARLAARGALRIGAGLVSVGCPPAAMAENAAQLTAIMLRPLTDALALTATLADDRINALCLGPGMGVSDISQSLLTVALKSGRALVLDADALTLLSRAPAHLALLHDKCVLTPHAGEFARLFPDIAAKLDAPATHGPAYSKVDATRAAAKRAGCVVLFKGPDTVIADPSGRCTINSAHYDRAAPWLATAGSGDVLSGFITGLLARGFDPMSAAETAAWLHVECALTFGPGLIAEDLPEQLPAVFRKLGL